MEKHNVVWSEEEITQIHFNNKKVKGIGISWTRLMDAIRRSQSIQAKIILELVGQIDWKRKLSVTCVDTFAFVHSSASALIHPIGPAFTLTVAYIDRTRPLLPGPAPSLPSPHAAAWPAGETERGHHHWSIFEMQSLWYRSKYRVSRFYRFLWFASERYLIFRFSKDWCLIFFLNMGDLLFEQKIWLKVNFMVLYGIPKSNQGFWEFR